jgi:WD40 repeat protein
MALATSGSDRLIRLWHVPSGRPAGVLSGHRNNIYGLAVSADGKRLVSTSSKETIRLWSLPQGKPLRTIRGVVGGASRVAFARGGRRVLAAVGSDVVLWDANTGKRLRTLRGHDSEIVRLRVTDDQRYAITSGRDNRVFAWDLRTQRPVQYTRFDMLPVAVDLSADHRRFAVSTGAPIHVLPFEPTLWRQDPGQLLKRSQRAADLRLERFRLVPAP